MGHTRTHAHRHPTNQIMTRIDLSGVWKIDAARSDPMADMLKLMGKGSVMAKIASKVGGKSLQQHITHTEDRIVVQMVLPVKKITIEVSLDGKPSEQVIDGTLSTLKGFHEGDALIMEAEQQLDGHPIRRRIVRTLSQDGAEMDLVQYFVRLDDANGTEIIHRQKFVRK